MRNQDAPLWQEFKKYGLLAEPKKKDTGPTGPYRGHWQIVETIARLKDASAYVHNTNPAATGKLFVGEPTNTDDPTLSKQVPFSGEFADAHGGDDGTAPVYWEYPGGAPFPIIYDPWIGTNQFVGGGLYITTIAEEGSLW